MQIFYGSAAASLDYRVQRIVNGGEIGVINVVRSFNSWLPDSTKIKACVKYGTVTVAQASIRAE